MATPRECEAALRQLAAKLEGFGNGSQQRVAVSRTLSCHLPDVPVSFTARLVDGQVHDLARGSDVTAQIKLTLSSEDLLALTDGRLSPAEAWAGGRLRIEAGMLDLVRLRALL